MTGKVYRYVQFTADDICFPEVERGEVSFHKAWDRAVRKADAENRKMMVLLFVIAAKCLSITLLRKVL